MEFICFSPLPLVGSICPALSPEGHCTCFGYLPLASHQQKVIAMQLVFRRMTLQVDEAGLPK